MILKYNNEKIINLVKYFETLGFADKLRLRIDMLESYHVKVTNDKMLKILKNYYVQLMQNITGQNLKFVQL